MDTRNGALVDFPNEADLARSVGHGLHLIETESFRSSDVPHKRLLIFERAFVVGLPVACAALFLIFLVREFGDRRVDSHLNT